VPKPQLPPYIRERRQPRRANIGCCLLILYLPPFSFWHQREVAKADTETGRAGTTWAHRPCLFGSFAPGFPAAPSLQGPKGGRLGTNAGARVSPVQSRHGDRYRHEVASKEGDKQQRECRQKTRKSGWGEGNPKGTSILLLPWRKLGERGASRATRAHTWQPYFALLPPPLSPQVGEGKGEGS